MQTQTARAPLDLAVETRPIDELKSYAGNARTHSKKQISQIAASIRQFGFTNPVLIDSEDRVMAGHGRVEAAKLVGMTSVPTIRLAHLTDGQRKAYILADNRLAQLSSWDEDILRIELQGLSGMDLDFDLEITGFETAKLDLLLDGPTVPAIDPKADKVFHPNAGPAVSRLGDLWRLGDHRVYCGDATLADSYAPLMAGEPARMVFTDPPYNVPIAGHVSGLGVTQHREFVMAAGEMSKAEFTDFLAKAFGLLKANSVDGSIHFLCMDWRHVSELKAAADGVYDEFKNLLVWVKDNGGMGTFYRSRHELVFAYKHGAAPHVNTFGLGETGRYRTNVLEYPGVNTFKAGKTAELDMHPTVKPVALVADLIGDVSRRGEIVLDTFGGSGTTLIAAQKTGRRARLLELDPVYVDVTCRRFEAFAGVPAILDATGQAFGDVVAERARAGEQEVANAQ